MLKATLWVQFLSQPCALSNGSCLACLWNVRKDQKGMVWKWNSKWMIFFLATRPRPVTLNMKNESNTSITKFFIYSGSSGWNPSSNCQSTNRSEKNFSGIYFALCTCRKALFTPMCVSWNAKLWSNDDPRAFRHFLCLRKETCVVFSILDFQRQR